MVFYLVWFRPYRHSTSINGVVILSIFIHTPITQLYTAVWHTVVDSHLPPVIGYGHVPPPGTTSTVYGTRHMALYICLIRLTVVSPTQESTRLLVHPVYKYLVRKLHAKSQNWSTASPSISDIFMFVINQGNQSDGAGWRDQVLSHCYNRVVHSSINWAHYLPIILPLLARFLPVII